MINDHNYNKNTFNVPTVKKIHEWAGMSRPLVYSSYFLVFFFFFCTIPGSGGPICAVGSIGLLCGGFIGRLTG